MSETRSHAVRIRAPSRLHFGLLSFPAPARWLGAPGTEDVPARRFGGAGLMIEAPGLIFTARPSKDWSAEGPLAARALSYARRVGSQSSPQHLTIESAPPEHAGLGTGTQLALAVGCAAAGGLGRVVEIAHKLGRGQRSALGVHGFMMGGFVVDGGKALGDKLAPLIAHAPFPDAWRMVLVVPTASPSVHGLQESKAFADLENSAASPERTERLCRLLVLGLLPGVVDADFPAFSEALYGFNRLAGEVFAPVQGGLYASSQIAESIEFIRGLGFLGAGQSSWGKTVFAAAEDDAQADFLAQRLRERLGQHSVHVIVTAAANRGAVLDTLAP